MASYETHTFQGPLNVVATVTATDLSHSFTLTDQNKLLQQLVKLPSLPTSVSVSMEGQGCAVMQVSPAHYRTEKLLTARCMQYIHTIGN